MKSRKQLITSLLLTGCTGFTACNALAVVSAPKLEVYTQSPWLTNGFTIASNGQAFINFPRFKGHYHSPALAKLVDGKLIPFPNNHWNQWPKYKDLLHTLVNVNAVHIFDNKLLWVVDQGAAEGATPNPQAAKLVAFDINTGNVKHLISFDNKVLPTGGAPNDLRIHGDLIYITDSGLGGIIIHNLKTGKSVRRLSEISLLQHNPNINQKGFNGRKLEDKIGNTPAVHSDALEVSNDGEWLYFATPTGPLYRVATAKLLDLSLSDQDLALAIQKVADLPSIGGSAIDKQGRIYISNVEERAIDRLENGKFIRLVQDMRLITPDALFIDKHNWIYIPAPQIEFMQDLNHGKEQTKAPWFIYRFKLND